MSAQIWFRLAACSAASLLLFGGCGGGGGGAGVSGGSTGGDSFPVIAKQAAAPQGDNITGSVNATDSTCTIQNGNQFERREDVYIQAGANGPRLPQGWYHVRITSPRPNGDESLLGSPAAQVYVTASGSLQVSETNAGCVQVWNVVQQAENSPGFAFTPNAGGVYKVWISKDATFPANQSRTDNFMVRQRELPPTSTTGSIAVKKFYDLNLNGIDDENMPVSGWLMQVLRDGYQSAILPTENVTGTVTFSNLPIDGSTSYLVTEREPVEVGVSKPYSWYATNAYDAQDPVLNEPIGDEGSTLNKLPAVLTPTARTKTVAFGNVCVGPAETGGGKTLGFWSNNNGRNAIETYNGANISKTAWNELGDLHLVDQDGSYLTYDGAAPNLVRNASKDFSTHTAFRAWLLAGNAQNMAYMLSVQLAAMKLNVLTNQVDGNAMIRADGVPAEIGGTAIAQRKKMNFMPVNDVIAIADLLLTEDPLTVAKLLPGMTPRERQERTKDALDNANNNRGFLQSLPLNCGPTFN